MTEYDARASLFRLASRLWTRLFDLAAETTRALLDLDRQLNFGKWNIFCERD
jgi:hypothetical protein